MNKKQTFLKYIMVIYIILMALLPSDFRIKGIPLRGDIIFGLLVVIYLMMLFVVRESRKNFIYGIIDFFKDYLSMFMVLLFIIMCISISYAVDKKIALSESIRFLSYIVFYFIIKYEMSNEKILESILKSYIYVCSIVSVLGILQFFTKIGLSEKFIYSTGAFKVRITSTLENPNSLGAFLILAVFPMIMLTLYETNRKKKVRYMCISILLFTNIILTGSRNAWLGFLVGSIVMIVIYNWKFIVPFILASITSLFIPMVRNRIKDFGKISQDGRVNLWKIAFEMIKDHPIIGVGNGNYYSLHGEYVKKYPQFDYNHHEYFPVHNSYLKIQSELGIFASMCFGGLIISILIKTKQFINNCNNIFFKAFYKGFYISIFSFLVMNMADNLFFVPKITVYFWILVAISQAMIYNNKRESII
ncbi:O-antigen ligase family protein [Clostridium aestuarii]|uniref:O-antigen ligase family protein n=1 Tax=Clostridium aestuarii TaxID=338193 RepID=A0ABT4CYV9_9CLOT|nr:O-antigen ligase family protein [Clostridium aestuarii]MCY6483577.1 O-antigen ligase family protein [Clostridium aestuarii]